MRRSAPGRLKLSLDGATMITAVLTSYLAAAASLPVHRTAGRKTGLLLAVFCLGLAGHFAMHLGQLSYWRRLQGKPALF